MSIASCAAAAVATFPNTSVQTTAGALPLPVVLVAIAGAESTWRDNAQGDYGLDSLFGLCDGYSSWGLWQIHNVHASYLSQASGSQDPCAWAAWLYIPANCAKAALAIYQSQGLGAWSTYTGGEWQGYITQAQSAIASLPPTQTGGGGGGAGSTAPSPPIPSLLLAGLGAGLFTGLGLLAGIAIIEGWI